MIDPDAPTALIEQHKGAADFRGAYRARIDANKLLMPAPNGPELPPGSYLGSCRGCTHHKTGKVLICTHCGLSGSPSTASTLKMADCKGKSGEVDNIGGELKCKPAANARNIPRGGYAGSCLGCTMSGTKVQCSDCGTAGGARVAASYDMARCPPPHNLGPFRRRCRPRRHLTRIRRVWAHCVGPHLLHGLYCDYLLYCDQVQCSYPTLRIYGGTDSAASPRFLHDCERSSFVSNSQAVTVPLLSARAVATAVATVFAGHLWPISAC